MTNNNVENNQRNESGKKDKESVDDEVQKLFKRSGGKINHADFQNLKNKYK